MSPKVTIVDYGSGNVFSVKRALEAVGADVVLTSLPDDVEHADRLVLPGVGAFGHCIMGLRERRLIDSLLSFAQKGRPMLGICVGMQILGTTSEEHGFHNGLDLIPGNIISVPKYSVDKQQIKVPFVGWSSIRPSNLELYENSILQTHRPESEVYLVHSFHFRPRNPLHLLANYDLGGHAISAAVQRDNVVGLQFHPEKSGRAGLNILRRFVYNS